MGFFIIRFHWIYRLCFERTDGRVEGTGESLYYFFFCTGDFLFFFLFCSLLHFNLASGFMIATVNLSGAKL